MGAARRMLAAAAGAPASGEVKERRRAGLLTLAAAATALAVTVAWIPFRHHAPSVDVALVLLVVITAAGVTGRRAPVAGAGVFAALGFTFFDTAPYDDLAINRASDIVTAALIVVVGLATGELAVRVMRQRRRQDAGAADDLVRVRNAAASLAAGDELVLMIGAVAADLSRLLGLRGCVYSADPIEEGSVWVGRDGQLRRDEEEIGWLAAMSRRRQVALPVWGQGQVLGHFVLQLGLELPTAGQLLVAITLSDQVGAALYAQAPPPLPGSTPPPPRPGLRIVR